MGWSAARRTVHKSAPSRYSFPVVSIRPNRKKVIIPRPTRTSQSVRGSRASKAEQNVQEELRRTRPRRRRKAETRAGAPDPEPTPTTKPRPRRSTRRRTASASGEVDTRIIHLAISPRAAVILLAAMGRMRYENEPALDAIKDGLKRDLEELGMA